MCTSCGCAPGETRIEGEALAAAPQASDSGDSGDSGDWHVHADGTAHQHAPASGHEEHSHKHTHADGTTHSHPHQHQGEHAHGHQGVMVYAPVAAHRHSHRHADGSEHSHPHTHDGAHHHDHPAESSESAKSAAAADAPVDLSGPTHDYGRGPAGAHAPGLSQSRMVQIEQDILSKNDQYAASNRERFGEQGLFVLNLVSSPGSGKTTLLCRTIDALGSTAASVIEGDQQTSVDADRIRATGAPAIQINTGKGCHLDAHMVGHALSQLAPADASVLFIENVGNLVCPAAFDLGEAHKVAILSVTEGEDKPLKYPDMFRAASLLLINKVDLLPYVSFSIDQAIANAQRVNPAIEVLRVSATTGEGFPAWVDWIQRGLQAQQGKRQATIAALKARIAALEAQLAAQSPR